MGFFDRINAGLARSRDKFKESMNVLLDRGPNLDEDFWDGLEETLILSDVGGLAASEIVENLRDQATRRALPDAYAVLDLLNDEIAATFSTKECAALTGDPAVILFVGINGTGKTTTVGKLAKASTDEGRAVILGSADTFRAAAIEQLEVWARRAGVEMVTRERGADPASVCYDTLERAETTGADLVLIDTAGRLHTSADLMRELEKVVSVVRKRSSLPVYTVLVIDATTGQNGLTQAREFNRALDLDALIVTKLDGTAKGGIALAVSHELDLPLLKIGVGEGIDDLRDFDAHEFASALVGSFDERFDEEHESLTGENAREAAISAGERRRDVIEGAPVVRVEATHELDVAAEKVLDQFEEGFAQPEDSLSQEADLVGITSTLEAGQAVVDEQADIAYVQEVAAAENASDFFASALGHRQVDSCEETAAEVQRVRVDLEAANAKAELETAVETETEAEAELETAEVKTVTEAVAEVETETEAETEVEAEAEGSEEETPDTTAATKEKKSFWKRLFE